jgi:hypothetical protein
MNTEHIKAMLCIDHIVWNALVCLLEKHPEESLHDPASPRWTSRDVYAHFARWLEHSNACITAYGAGKAPPELPGTVEEMNGRWQKEDAAVKLADARTKAMAAFARRIGIIEAIPLDKWGGELGKLVNYDVATHYAMHINYITVVK